MKKYIQTATKFNSEARSEQIFLLGDDYLGSERKFTYLLGPANHFILSITLTLTYTSITARSFFVVIPIVEHIFMATLSFALHTYIVSELQDTVSRTH